MILKPKLITKIEPGHWASKGLVGSWLFNEGGGDIAYDTSGYGNHGILAGAAHSVPGNFGPSLDFNDGTGDVVDTGNGLRFVLGGAPAMTVIVNIHTEEDNSIGGSRNPLSFVGGGFDVFSLHYDATENIIFEADDTLHNTISATAVDFLLGKMRAPYTLVGVMDGSNVLLYIDDILEASTAWPGGVLDTTNQTGTTLKIGLGMLGQIDFVSLYNRALSASEITSLYVNPFQMFEREPAIFYSFAAGGEAIVRTIDDSLGVTDAQTKSATFARTFAESIGTTDVTAKIAIHLRVLAESLGITDATVKAETKLLTEALGITDTQTKDETKVLAESLGITDSVIRTCIIIRAFAESLGITDAVSQAAVLSRVLSEALGVTDVMTRTQVQTRIETESIGITDATIKTQVQLRVITDVLGITDMMQRSQFITFTESMGITDDVAKLITFIRTESEAVGITDSIVRVAVMLRTVSDDLGLTDEVSEELGALVKAAWAFVILRQTHS